MANKVEVEITGNNAGAKSSIKDTEKDLTRLGATANTVTGRVGASFNKMGNFFKQNSTAIMLGATAAAGALGYMMKKAIDTADNMSKAAQRIGVATEELSTLEYAAKLSGVSFSSLETGLARFNRNIFDAARGAGEARFAFQTLGISTRTTEGNLKTADQSLKDIAEKFAGMQDGAQKTALAMQLFGRSGAQLIPMLNQGKDGIGALQDEARKLGLEISTNTGKQAELFNDNMTRLKSVATGVGLKIATEMLPAINGVSNALATFATNSNVAQNVGGGLAMSLKLLATGFGAVGLAAYTSANALGTWWATIATFFSTGSFNRAGNVLSKGIDGISEGFKTFMSAFESLWSDASNQIPEMTSNVNNLSDSFVDVTGKVRTVKDEIKYLDAFLRNNISSAFEILSSPNLNRGYEMGMIANVEQYRQSAEAQMDLIAQVTEFDMAMAVLREQGVSDMFSNMAGAAMGFYDASGQASKSAFAIYKAMAIAQTGIATYQAAVEAYKSMVGIPIVGPGLAIAAAAAATAFGLGNIARISAMSPGGGVGAGSPSAGSVPRIPNITNNSNGGNEYNVHITVSGNYGGGRDRDYWEKIAREYIVPSVRKAQGDTLGGGG